MKPAPILLAGCVTVLATWPPPAAPNADPMAQPRRPSAWPAGGIRTEPGRRKVDDLDARRAAGNLVSAVNALQAMPSREGSGGSRSAGDLWIEVGRLKRGGRDVRSIEWHVSELEESLRREHPDAVARRHLLNNLSYEVEALDRRSR